MSTYVYRVRPEHRIGRGTYWRAKGAGYTDDINQAGRYDDPRGANWAGPRAEAVPLADELARIGALGEIGTLVHAEHPHICYTDSDLVRRAATSAHRGHGRATRRGHIMDAFGVGSGVADTICRACGMDPDEVVGEDNDDDDIDADGEE